MRWAKSTQRVHARDAPRVRISALPSLASAWLVARLPRFAALHPDIRIHLDSDRSLARFLMDDTRLASSLLADGRIVLLPGPAVPARFSYFLVHPSQRQASEPAARFIEWLQHEAARDNSTD
jgi:DNA-binding transcriptional LysR family regulator